MLDVTQIPQRIGWYVAGFADGEGSFNVSVQFGFLSAKKQRDFAKFKQITRLIQQEKRLSKEGIGEILEIRRDMNDGGAMRRKYSDDSINELFRARESSETVRQAPGAFSLADDTVRSA
jgi:hypothetical protein